MIKDLLMPVTGTAADNEALAAAVALASHFAAHLSIVVTVDMPMPTAGAAPWGRTPVLAEDLYAQLRAEAEGEAAVFRRHLEQTGVSHEVRLAESLFTEPPRTVALHARYADLGIVAGGPRAPERGAGIVRRFFSAMLLESGRPLLVIPPQASLQLPLVHAVVAWRPGREATRALHDALPLLRTASTVDVVTVDPKIDEFEHGEIPGADIATHLSRHGLEVNVIAQPRQDDSVAGNVFRHARESGAQLVVAGGYGHSRLREWALGGATRDFLDQLAVPVLFSH